MNTSETRRDAQRVKTNREELTELIGRAVSEDGAKEVFPGFFLARSSRTSESLHAVYKPAFCFIAQGRKRALLGEEVFTYDPGITCYLTHGCNWSGLTPNEVVH